MDEDRLIFRKYKKIEDWGAHLKDLKFPIEVEIINTKTGKITKKKSKNRKEFEELLKNRKGYESISWKG